MCLALNASLTRGLEGKRRCTVLLEETFDGQVSDETAEIMLTTVTQPLMKQFRGMKGGGTGMHAKSLSTSNSAFVQTSWTYGKVPCVPILVLSAQKVGTRLAPPDFANRGHQQGYGGRLESASL